MSVEKEAPDVITELQKVDDDYYKRVLGEIPLEQHLKEDAFFLIYSSGSRWKENRLFALRCRKVDSLVFSRYILIDSSVSSNFGYTVPDPSLTVKYQVVYREHNHSRIQTLKDYLKDPLMGSTKNGNDRLNQSLRCYVDGRLVANLKNWCDTDYVEKHLIHFIKDSLIAENVN